MLIAHRSLFPVVCPSIYDQDNKPLSNAPELCKQSALFNTEYWTDGPMEIHAIIVTHVHKPEHNNAVCE